MEKTIKPNSKMILDMTKKEINDKFKKNNDWIPKNATINSKNNIWRTKLFIIKEWLITITKVHNGRLN